MSNKNSKKDYKLSALTNNVKRFSAMVLSLLMVLQLTACADMSWCIKYSDESLPAGVYIYNMYAAYQEVFYESYYKGMGYSSNIDVLSQTMEEKPAVEWIEETAMNDIKNILSVDAKMKELGIEFTEEEETKARQQGDSNWQKIGATLEKFGVSRNSFDISTSLLSEKTDKLFDSIYGPNGTQAVTDDQIKAYFSENYIDYEIISKDIPGKSVFQDTEASSDESAKSPEEEILVESDKSSEELNQEGNDNSADIEEEKKIQQQFQTYEDMINQGYTMQDVDAKYQQDDELSESQLFIATEDINNANMPQDVKDAYVLMPNNTVKTIKSGTTYYLVYKKDINNQISKLDDENFKKEVLKNMKNEEFNSDLENNIESLDYQINNAVIKKYTPYMFEKDKETTSSKKSKSNKSK